MKVSIGNDGDISLKSLRRGKTNAAINDAVLIAKVLDMDDNQLGSNITLSYEAGTSGNYYGLIPASIPLVDQQQYRIEITASNYGIKVEHRFVAAVREI